MYQTNIKNRLKIVREKIKEKTLFTHFLLKKELRDIIIRLISKATTKGIISEDPIYKI